MLWLILNLILISVFNFNAGEKIYATDDTRNALLKDILNNYQPSARPAHANETIMLFVNIEIQHFDYREKDGAFHLVGLLQVKWRDPKLVWNPQSYGNMSHILISQRYIWVPDLEFYNNAPDKFIRMHRNGFVTVKNDGVVFWSDSIDVNVFCTADMKNWPHDKHECNIILGSWTFDGFEVDIMHLEPNSSMTFSSIDMKNMEYKITSFSGNHTSKYYSCCLQPYVTMDYDITFQRQSSYVVIFRMPALIIILFTLIGLRMEPNRKEKLWLNGLSLILISWQLIYFAKNIAHFHGTPYIVIFFSTSLVMVTLAQLLAVFSLYASLSNFKGYLPVFIEIFLNFSFTRYLVPIETKNTDHSEANGQFEEVKLDDTSNLIDRNLSTNDWLRFAKVLNILAFLSFSFIFLVLSSVCFV
ncbi:neuronal acetylcholine receptor subunit alpha-5-like [Lucilia cuprina]|uniref:neuronal acetylcholine receptor subunit alpha-5-like n=1 Tax=Lucilia cuprina TaxID=7375 RepID=UPI001F064884|nr:neuronal acetylcholine receptor subunit alpha-5-like [Lucilia cuprina]